MGNWTEQLARQRAGEIPGHIGANEPVEAFLERQAAERAALAAPAPEPTPAPITPAQAAAQVFGTVQPPSAAPVAPTSSTPPRKRAPAKKTAAKRTGKR